MSLGMVHNTAGTECNCGCGSWLNHWERYAEQTPVLCSNLFCMGDAETGGFVIKEGDTETVRYVIPLCVPCTEKPDPFVIRPSTRFIPAAKKMNCGFSLR